MEPIESILDAIRFDTHFIFLFLAIVALVMCGSFIWHDKALSRLISAINRCEERLAEQAEPKIVCIRADAPPSPTSPPASDRKPNPPPSTWHSIFESTDENGGH